MSRICIKVDNLRKLGYDNLEGWLKDEYNIYIGRAGRIFIKDKGTGDKIIFHCKKSIFHNPYNLKEYNLCDSLYLYEKYLIKSLLINNLEQLWGKNLGCFCESGNHCHGDILIKYLNLLSFNSNDNDKEKDNSNDNDE